MYMYMYMYSFFPYAVTSGRVYVDLVGRILFRTFVYLITLLDYIVHCG